MISLKNRLIKNINIEKLNELISSIENGQVVGCFSKQERGCLGITDEWIISNGFEVKNHYSDEEGMQMLHINHFENQLKFYLDLNNKHISEDASIHYFDNDPFIKFSDIYPQNTHLLFIMWNASGFAQSFFEYHNEMYVSESFFRTVGVDEKFLKDFAFIGLEFTEKKQIQKTYIMVDHNTGFYKIGKSTNPLVRENTLASEKPTIELLLICEENIERKLHKDFSNKRVRGEWFSLSADDLLDLIEFKNFKPIIKK
jgi:hypothetical protein